MNNTYRTNGTEITAQPAGFTSPVLIRRSVTKSGQVRFHYWGRALRWLPLERRRRDRGLRGSQVSRYNRPMRQYQPPRLVCRSCGQPVSAGQYGGWEHVKRVGITDPAWHRAEVAA